MTHGSSRLPDLGPRGEGWFAIQLALMGAIVGLAFVNVYWPNAAADELTVIGIIAIALGIVLFVVGLVSVGGALSPFPRPRDRGALVDRGIYRTVRHPLYGAIILIALGWSLAEAPLGLIPTAALALFLDLKARREEAWLQQRYPEYAAYAQRTRRRFVPFLY
jgi:protein-S-isoprenylcysteine O-methyltransferase Ste14